MDVIAQQGVEQLLTRRGARHLRDDERLVLEVALEHLLVEGLADVVGVALLDDALPDVVLAAEAQGDGYVELGEQPVDVRETARALAVARRPERVPRRLGRVAERGGDRA